MTHPARLHQAEQLQRRHPDLGIEIVLDPEPDGKPATLRTAKLAWSKIREGATHHMVLQEDVQLCTDFSSLMHHGLQVAPEGAISFFACWTMSTAQAIRLAAVCGASWTPVVDSWTPTLALVLPAEVARGFAGFAEQYASDKPDNRAMAEYLADRDLTTYVSVPNLVEHRPTQSLLLNDLLYGARHSTVFPASADVGPAPFTERIATPPAVANLGRGDFESFCHYDPLIGWPRSSTAPGPEVLMTYGMTAVELGEAFASDLDYHPEATANGLSESLLFQLWTAAFIQGHVARAMLCDQGSLDFDAALDGNRWARTALSTFPASALRRTYPRAVLARLAEQLTPLCISAMRSGFSAVDHWPGLAALWRPDQHEIRPRWNQGDKVTAEALS
ncbi:hypothetical protein ACIRG5_06080 [Lentzea sp. NPDC102401]|uniref:hypothetical protein n=1 Tax=Lentzea sp. NPDC102401 TaxID=3364128 RepID=UPI003829EB62